jgi:transcriptional regulator with XRE-family HTH domain
MTDDAQRSLFGLLPEEAVLIEKSVEVQSKGKTNVRGRREKELEVQVPSEGKMGMVIRAWRRQRGMTVTHLAVLAGFGKNGRSYISKIEHHQIRRLGEEQVSAIAQALGLTIIDLQQGRLPETHAKALPGKEALDEAIFGCKAWLKVYDHQDEKLLDRARTHVKLAELYWQRIPLAEGRAERERFFADALQNIDHALPIFRKEAPGSYEEVHHLRTRIEREIRIQDLDDAIAGCNALFKVHRQEEHPLDWARTHARLAQLYWDRATQAEQAEERHGWLGKALHSIDQALPLFRRDAPTSYDQAQQMRQYVEGAREGW